MFIATVDAATAQDSLGAGQVDAADLAAHHVLDLGRFRFTQVSTRPAPALEPGHGGHTQQDEEQ